MQQKKSLERKELNFNNKSLQLGIFVDDEENIRFTAKEVSAFSVISDECDQAIRKNIYLFNKFELCELLSGQEAEQEFIKVSAY